MDTIDTYIPVSIIGCPIEFSVSKKKVFFDTDVPPSKKGTLLAPGRIFTHPILGNMRVEFMNMNGETGHGTKVFCQLLDNKVTNGIIRVNGMY